MRGGVTRIGVWCNGCNRVRIVLAFQLFQMGVVLVTALV